MQGNAFDTSGFVGFLWLKWPGGGGSPDMDDTTLANFSAETAGLDSVHTNI